jgi:hypothetical protein
MKMTMKMMTNFVTAVSSRVNTVSELTDEQLKESLFVLERAYTHCIIEQRLRNVESGGRVAKKTVRV